MVYNDTAALNLCLQNTSLFVLLHLCPGVPTAEGGSFISVAVQYEPTIEELRHKYEVAMKEKMLVRLEKERLQARTEALEAQVPSLVY